MVSSTKRKSLYWLIYEGYFVLKKVSDANGEESSLLESGADR